MKITYADFHKLLTKVESLEKKVAELEKALAKMQTPIRQAPPQLRPIDAYYTPKPKGFQCEL